MAGVDGREVHHAAGGVLPVARAGEGEGRDREGREDEREAEGAPGAGAGFGQEHEAPGPDRERGQHVAHGGGDAAERALEHGRADDEGGCEGGCEEQRRGE